MISPEPSDHSPGEEPPGVPGLRSWRSVYLLVFGWFVLVVLLLAMFTRFFA